MDSVPACDPRAAGRDPPGPDLAGRRQGSAGKRADAHRLPGSHGAVRQTHRILGDLRADRVRAPRAGRSGAGTGGGSQGSDAGAVPRRASAARGVHPGAACLLAPGGGERDQSLPHRAEDVRGGRPHSLGRRPRVLDHLQHQRPRAQGRACRLRPADPAADRAAAAQRHPRALAVRLDLLGRGRRLRQHARLGLDVPASLRLAADGRDHRPAGKRRPGAALVLPGRPGRLPHRLQRRLRPRLRARQDPLPLRDRGLAEWRSRMARREPLFRPVGPPIPAADAAACRRTDGRGTHQHHCGRDTGMNSRILRKAALAVALGACMGSMAPLAMAQSATGAVAGRAAAGDQLVLTSEQTGLSRTVTAGNDGSYRLSQLPVGNYRLQVLRDGQPVGAPVEVSVSLGGTTSVNLGSDGAVANLDTIEVVGSRVVNRVDVFSIETATNVNREEIGRLPVAPDLASVAMLAPGVIGGNSSLGGISFGGSSIAENSVYINGLNVTDFYRRQSFSSAPFAFFDQFQIKTGGYSVEFGRSTGGVINAVTRSGTNELKGGVEFTFAPEALRSRADDHRFYDVDGAGNPVPVDYRSSRDERDLIKGNAWASGPLVRDKLFIFAMYEQQKVDSGYTLSSGASWNKGDANNGFWGAKLDWNINENHLLELLAFSDEA